MVSKHLVSQRIYVEHVYNGTNWIVFYIVFYKFSRDNKLLLQSIKKTNCVSVKLNQEPREKWEFSDLTLLRLGFLKAAFYGRGLIWTRFIFQEELILYQYNYI